MSSTRISEKIDFVGLVYNSYLSLEKDVEKLLRYKARNGLFLMLLHDIQQLRQRRQYGDLKDLRDADFPTPADMNTVLNRRKIRRVICRLRKVEASSKRLIRGLALESFNSQFNQLEWHQQLELKQQFASALFHTEAGTTYLQKEAFNQQVSGMSGCYSLTALEKDLRSFEQYKRDWPGKIPDLSNKLARLLLKIMPLFARERQTVVLEKVLFIQLRSIQVLAEIDLGIPGSFSSFQASFTKVQITAIFERRISSFTLGNRILAHFGLLMAFGKVFSSLYTGAFDGKSALAVGKDLADFVDEAAIFGIEYYAANPIKYQKISDIASATSRFVVSPLLLCYELRNTSEAIVNGDDRVAVVGALNMGGLLAGMFLTGGVGLAFGLAFLVGGILVNQFMYSKEKEHLLLLLQYSRFGIGPQPSNDLSEYQDALNDPLSPLFEWDQGDRNTKRRRQLRALFSALNPLKFEAKLDKKSDHCEVKLTFSSPPLPKLSYYLDIRFFNDDNSEVRHKQYRLPIDLKDIDQHPSANWKSRSANTWFVRHSLDMDTMDTRQRISIAGRINSYEVVLRLPEFAYITHEKVIVQFWPLSPSATFLGPNRAEDERAIWENPHIYQYASAL